MKDVKELINHKPNIIAHKEIIYTKEFTNSTNNSLELRVNHLDELITFCRNQLGNSEILNSELEELTK